MVKRSWRRLLKPQIHHTKYHSYRSKLSGTGNGNPGDHSNEKLPVRRAFNGLCQVLVRSGENEKIVVSAKANGLIADECEIDVSEKE